MRRWTSEAARRVGGASKTQLVLDLLNAIALVYQFSAGGFVAYSRAGGVIVSPLWAYGLAPAIIYSTVHRLWLSGRYVAKRLSVITVQQSTTLAAAVSSLAKHVRTSSEDVVVLDRIEHGLLVALKAELECLMQDNEGIYLNVSLMVEDENDPSRIRCCRRSNIDREVDRTYSKDGTVSGQAMISCKPQCEHDLTIPGKPYKSILAVPIVNSEGRAPTAVGAITIDSSRPFHFEGIEDSVVVRMAPYAALHQLVLSYRASRNIRR